MNVNRLKIKRCCASCEHKEIDENGKRTCRLKAMRVERRYRCKEWQLSEGLRKWQEATSL